MDTEKIMPYQGFDINNVTIPDLYEEELNTILKYIEITRYVQEIHQLFAVFCYNLLSILNTYELNNSDKLIRHKSFLGDFDDRTEINALIISYISAGKTLTDSLEACMLGAYSSNNAYREYKELLSKVYDKSFSYRLLVRLRDYSQHGHLPVSVDNNVFCFDIAQIIETPHFNHNKSLKDEMGNFTEELLVKRKTHPHYVFSLAVAEYTAVIAKIYYEFWIRIKGAFSSLNDDFSILIANHPEYIIHKDKKFNGWCFYQLNNTLHGFNTKEDSSKMIKQYTDEAELFYDNEEKELQSFRSYGSMV
jgi:hypothetical protein